MYVLALEHAGMHVRSARDADSALAAMAEWLPDVVITDFLLGGGRNGAELCRELHRNPRTAHIPALVMTGSTRKHDAEAILGAGCADVRIKPYLPDALVADVHRLSKKSAA
jgi:CheY-like chemotaxis protein